MAILGARLRRASLPCASAAWSSPAPLSIDRSPTNCATPACPSHSILAAGPKRPNRKTEKPRRPSASAWRSPLNHCSPFLGICPRRGTIHRALPALTSQCKVLYKKKGPRILVLSASLRHREASNGDRTSFSIAGFWQIPIWPLSRVPNGCHPVLGAASPYLQPCPRRCRCDLDCGELAPFPPDVYAAFASAPFHPCAAGQRLLLRRIFRGHRHAEPVGWNRLETPALGTLGDRNALRCSSCKLLDCRRDLSFRPVILQIRAYRDRVASWCPSCVVRVLARRFRYLQGTSRTSSCTSSCIFLRP